MSEEKTRVVRSGASLSTILTVIFVIAKLFGVINWSWWLVFLPTIISVGLSIVALLIMLIIAIIAATLD